MALAEAGEEPGDEPASGGADHPHPDGAHDLPAEGHHVGHHGGELDHHSAGPADNDGAFLGQPARRPVDQLDVELPLQPGDVGRDVGLHGAERLGGGGEAPGVGDPDQGLQVPLRSMALLDGRWTIVSHLLKRYQVSRTAH